MDHLVMRDRTSSQEAASTLLDNISALYLTINPTIHPRTKRIEFDYHFVHEKVTLGDLVTQFVTSVDQVADVFAKPLVKTVFHQLRTKLGVSPPPSLRGSDKEHGPKEDGFSNPKIKQSTNT